MASSYYIDVINDRQESRLKFLEDRYGKSCFGIDLDGVLYPWHEAMFDYLKLYSSVPKNMPFSEFWSLANLSTNPKLTRTFWENITRDTTLYTRFVVEESIIACLNKIAMKQPIVYITSRPLNTCYVTEKWIRLNKLPCPNNLFFSVDREGVVPKALFVNKLCTVFIDDMRRSFEEIDTDTCKTYIVDMPYNEDFNKEGITRVSNLYQYFNRYGGFDE